MPEAHLSRGASAVRPRRRVATVARLVTARLRFPLALLVLLLAPADGLGQSRPGAAATPEPEWIRPEEVPARADALLRRLDAVRPDPSAVSSLELIERSLPALDRDLDAVVDRVRAALARSAPLTDLEDLRRELLGVSAPLAAWKESLATESSRVAGALDGLSRSQRAWSATRVRPETTAAGDVVVRRVESSIAALDAAAADLRAWRARVLAANDHLVDRDAVVDSSQAKLQAGSAAERASLFVRDRPPLWAGDVIDEIRDELPRVPGKLLEYTRSTATYVERNPRPLLGQVLLAAFLMLALGRLATRTRKRLPAAPADSRLARLLERPYSTGLLFALLATPALHPLAPRRILQLVAMLALVPTARIIVHASQRANLPAFAALFVVLLLDRFGSAVETLPGLARVTYLLALAIGIALAAWWARPLRLGRAPAWAARAARLAALGLGLAFLAEVAGWSQLAGLFGRGLFAGAIAGLYIYAGSIALAALIGRALASRTVRRSYLVERNTAILQRRAERVLRWLGVGLWLFLVLTGLGLRGAGADMFRTVLGAGVSVGALSLSVGGVLAFVLTLLGAMLLVRVVNGVLEADIYPRTDLPRGVPYALSTLVRYGVYTLGFLFALAAAGVQPAQVTIMLGGLGIGIGLGLQDLVKNFAAGLTLLLERRVSVGDTLEMPSHGIFGRVLSIGMRASVVRTWSGAEVVVPNADLISSAVTNWTLSDRLCRIEVAVGVAYGTDPERVVTLLLDAVGPLEHFLPDPAPQVLFKGFGESSLDFLVRAWTDRGYDQSMSLTSQLALAVNRALTAGGITIPFPQRDLHLASVSPAARAALARRDG